ncbi:hypothetical protein [Comamonas antarctica]|uniref:hypothetical protein n=1 Tax=Comamonas antarctica TaxID=2743470 RepID=UPI0028EDC2BF|nr:hypothetical protein [Comamonas antarctica]
MSSVNFLETLLDGAAVEWKKIGDVALRITSGGTPKTDVNEYWENGEALLHKSAIGQGIPNPK